MESKSQTGLLNQYEEIISEAQRAADDSRWNISLIVTQIILLVIPYKFRFEPLLCLIPLDVFISLLTVVISYRNIQKIRNAQLATQQVLPGIALNRIWLVISTLILGWCAYLILAFASFMFVVINM